jgi:hypothetical protein
MLERSSAATLSLLEVANPLLADCGSFAPAVAWSPQQSGFLFLLQGRSDSPRFFP